MEKKKSQPNPKTKISLFAGSFDPIHLGHIDFAISVINQLGIDQVYFLPEWQPRGKQVTHYAHRLAMIKLAIRPYSKLKVLELPDKQFTISKTLPKIKEIVGDNELYFMFGSDKAEQISNWPNYQALLNNAKIIISLREDESKDRVLKAVANWPTKPIIQSSKYKDVSSGKIREALLKNQKPKGLPKSAEGYIKKNWLYVSISSNV